jgi:monoamine oxidase
MTRAEAAGADVIVVGAGMAGLAAAERLATGGCRVLVLEARDRLGGRIHTVRAPGLALPIELGAEFVHGRPAELVALIERLGLTLVEVPERHDPGRQAPPLPDLRGTLARLLEAGDASVDRPVAALLDEQAATVSHRELEAVRRYLESFHAADLARLGTRALAQNEAAEDEDGDEGHRIREGYTGLVERLAAEIDPARCGVRLGSPVSRLRWREGQVRVTVDHGSGAAELLAPRVVLTVPLPVLARWTGGAPPALDPVPEGWREALGALSMGPAHRMVLVFDERWWAPDGGAGPSFVHGADEPFPVWWTALPSREPAITGWAGGPRAAALAGRGEAAMLDATLASLGSVFGRNPAELRARLVHGYGHDWSADPWAGGAYSYGGVGALEARQALASPVADTLFLAGEAVAELGRNATVHGALASGRRTADAILDRA